MHEKSPTNYNLLPADKPLDGLLLPFFGPYFLYILLPILWPELYGAEWSQAFKLVGVGLAMAFWWRYYRFPPLELKVVGISLIATPVALALWIAPLYLFVDTSPGAIERELTEGYFWLRLINSVLLVALFEELLTRVYLMEWFRLIHEQMGSKGFVNALFETLDEKATPRSTPPLVPLSIGVATLAFTLGHHSSSYLSAILYFGFTTWLYHVTRSLWSCILVHALTNLAIAFMVRELGMKFLWW